MTFDLEKARATYSAGCAEDAANLVPDLIAEIEWLRGEMENYGDDYVCQMKSKDARIKELEDALAEGKIGPDAKPRSWQITEERKAALGVILARIEYDQSLPGRFNYTVSRAKDTLRAMLEEAQP